MDRARWQTISEAALLLGTLALLTVSSPLWGPLWLVFLLWDRSRSRRFAEGRAAARRCTIDASGGETLDVLLDDRPAERIPLADIRWARWWRHVHPAGGFASGDDYEEFLIELDLSEGGRRLLLVDWQSHRNGMEPLVERGLLPRKPRHGGSTGGNGLFFMLAVMALVIGCMVAALYGLHRSGLLGW